MAGAGVALPRGRGPCSATVLAVWLWRQDGPMLHLVLGSALNAALSKVLKALFRQQRPPTAAKDDPGMPSSHAMVRLCVTFLTPAPPNNRDGGIALCCCNARGTRGGRCLGAVAVRGKVARGMFP